MEDFRSLDISKIVVSDRAAELCEQIKELLENVAVEDAEQLIYLISSYTLEIVGHNVWMLKPKE